MKHIFIHLICFFFSLTAINGQSLITNKNGLTNKNLTNNEINRDGNGALNLSYSLTKCGLNFVQSSVMITERYIDDPGNGLPVDLSINTIPSCGKIENAFIYWTTSSSNIDPSFIIDGNSLNGLLIGSGPDKCWSLGATYHYRADITSFINGNGLYNFDFGSGNMSTDGATLLIVYSDSTANFEGTIILHDGCIVNVNGLGYTYNFSGINSCSNTNNSLGFVVSADLQNNIAPPTYTLSIGNNQNSFPNSFYNFDTISVDVNQNTTNLDFTITPSNGDCFSNILAGLYFQTNCNSCGNAGNTLASNYSAINDTCLKCVGQAELFISGGSGTYNYSWQPQPGFGQNTSNATGLCFGSYTIHVTDNNCNALNMSISIDSTGTVPNISITSVDSVCNSFSQFILTAVDGGGIWSGIGIIDSINGIFDPQIAGAGNYYVNYSLSNSMCTNSDSILISILEEPIASFNYTQLWGDYSFNNSSSNATNYFWDFGDGFNSNNENPNHSYAINGTYTVCLTVDNNGVCYSTFCDTILFTGQSIFEIEQLNLIVYPNPTYDFIHLKSNFIISKVEISDYNNRLILSSEENGNEIEIDLNKIANGFYFLHVFYNKSNKMIPIKIIKQ